MKQLRRAAAIVLSAILFISTAGIDAAAAKNAVSTHVAQVAASNLRLRSGPSTDSKTLSMAPRGDYVNILGKSGAWYQVEYNLTVGYMHQSYLSVYTAKNVELGYGRITGNKVNIRSGPGTGYSVLTRGSTGSKAYIIGFNNQWYKVIFGSYVGYIRSDYLELTEIPYENAGSDNTPLFYIDGKSTGITPSATALYGTTASTRQAVVSSAKKLLGIPYVWGGTTTGGFDCSGFVQYVFAQHGISLPRTTAAQVAAGKAISKSELQPGDLVFLQNTYRAGVSHVGIYIGDGKMIHASSSRGVTTSSLSTSYYVKHYHSARRVL